MMRIFRMPLTLLALGVLFSAGCGKHRKVLNGEEPVTFQELLDAYPDLSTPYVLSDTGLLPSLSRMNDSARIAYAVFTQFIPDSLAARFGVKDAGVYPLGKITKQKDIYLVTVFAPSRKKAVAAVFFLDQGKKCVGAYTVLKAPSTDGYRHTLNVNKEPTFSINRDRFTGANQVLFTHKGVAFSKSAGRFIQVISDTNEDTARNNLVQDPIDTLPRHNKYSGNYAIDRKNFVSIRDGRNAQGYEFFIHFEKEEDCAGEIKGELTMRDARTAVFHHSGDPCEIEFSFGASSLTIKENGKCGNHRGLRCPFDDTYPRRREARVKPAHKKG